MSSEQSIHFQNQEKEEKNIDLQKNQNQKNEENNNNENNIDLNITDNLDINKIKELNSNSVNFIFEEKIEIALEILKKLELFLETNVVESKLDYDKKLIVIILHNLSCCYQKIKDYDNCIVYLGGVIYHFDKELEKKHKITINEDYFYNNLFKDQSNYPLLGDLILELRFSAKFHLQMCAALSQANRHIEALRHAKLAGLMCEDNIIKTHYLFIQMQSQNLFSNESNKINNEVDNEIDNNINDLEKQKLTQKIIKDLFTKIKNIKNHFIQNDNINKILEKKPKF